MPLISGPNRTDDSTSSTNWRNAPSLPEVPEGCGRIESIRGLCPCSTSYGLKPTVLISAMRHGQRSFRDMCRMPAVAEGHVPGWPEPNTPQRSLRDMYGICLRGGSARKYSVAHPEIIKFQVSKPSAWFEPSTLVKSAVHPHSSKPPEAS